MGVLWLEKRQSCASGFAWYVCSNGPGFRGCCSMDPCTDGVCPAASQGTNLDAVSTTSPTQRIITTTPRETPTSTTPTSTTPRITSTPTTTASPLTTTASPLTTITLSPTLTTADEVTVSPQETRVTTTVRGTDTIVIETTGGRTITISLNGDSTATVTSGPTTSTAVAGASENSESGNNMGPIIGGAVAGVVFLIILVAAFFFIRGRRREHNASPPYGAVSERSNGVAGFFAGIFPKKHASGSNINSMASPDSPNPAKAGFFGFGFLKRRGDTDAHYRDDTKVPDTPGSPPPLPGFTEMPAQSFAPLHPNVHLPYNMVELDSDAVTAPSELSAVSTPLYHTTRTSSSAWSPTPELPSEVSNSSTGAVLSPMRETHYSETSTAGGSPRPGQQSWAQPEQNSNLRGGGWPGMRANLNSLRRKPTRASSSLAPPPPPLPPQDPNTHVLSWMDYNADPGSSGHGGVIR